MVRCDEPDRNEDEVEGWHIILSQWFKGAVYPVEKIRRGWLFFRKDRDYGTGMWSELRFGRCLPRYILCHPPVRPDLHACGTSSFLAIRDSKLGSVSMDGVAFLGNRAGEPLIRLDRLAARSVRITGCQFSGIRSAVISTEETDHLLVKDCSFRMNYLSCLSVGEGGVDVRIEHNRFLDTGLMMTNAPVVHCQAKDYRIASNYFEDFSYSAVGVGIHYTKPDRFGTSGVVEKNEICMSEAYRQAPMRSLIDGGAIYVWTQNKDLIIRENYIHDIAGPHGNRGIFGDDGVVNLTITGNTVLRVRGSYAIDVRRVHRIGRRKDSAIRLVNVGIVIKDNIYDGRVRIHVRKDDRDSYYGENTDQDEI
jgi:hypothetical protein